MRNLLLATALAAPFLVSGPAFAQSASGSEPMSTKASNTGPGNTHTQYAPRLPSPTVGDNASARSLLSAAKADIAAHRTGAAQEALEQAETRLLDRTVDPSMAGTADSSAMVSQISQARLLLGRGDTGGAARMIDSALGAG